MCQEDLSCSIGEFISFLKQKCNWCKWVPHFSLGQEPSRIWGWAAAAASRNRNHSPAFTATLMNPLANTGSPQPLYAIAALPGPVRWWNGRIMDSPGGIPHPIKTTLLRHAWKVKAVALHFGRYVWAARGFLKRRSKPVPYTILFPAAW